jgi:hypothetical protein
MFAFAPHVRVRNIAMNPKSPTRSMIVTITRDGHVLHRSRAETWLGALADAAAPANRPAPTGLSPAARAWARTGQMLRRGMARQRGEI